jgi:hypothetical protein
MSLTIKRWGKINNNFVGFEVLMEVSTKMAVFWVAAPRSVAEAYQRYRDLYYHHLQCDK